MEFNLKEAKTILRSTPKVLKTLLEGLSGKWFYENEGNQTWSPFDIVGHLIEGEKNDWMVRVKLILSGSEKTFTPFDRFSQEESSRGKDMDMLLAEFEQLRLSNLEDLETLEILPNLDQKGVHPEFGAVTLKELLATWVVHDINHINQMTRVIAGNLEFEVGPWKAYLGVLNK